MVNIELKTHCRPRLPQGNLFDQDFGGAQMHLC